MSRPGTDDSRREQAARLRRLRLPADCPAAEQREQLQVATLLEALGADPQATWERIDYLQRHRRPEAERRTAAQVLHRVQHRRAARRRRRAVVGLVLVGAVAATAALLLLSTPPSAATWRALDPGLQWRPAPTAAWQAVPAGEQRDGGSWRASEAARLAQEGVSLRLDAEAELRSESAGVPELIAGSLHCRVEPVARGWRLHAGPARIVVHGTVFSVRRASTFSQVLVEEGLVAVRRATDGAAIRLRADEALRLRADGPLRSCPQDGWYPAAAQAYSEGRRLLDDEWRAGAPRHMALQPGLTVDGVAHLQAADEGTLSFFQGPDLPPWPAVEVRFAMRGALLGPDPFCNFFNLGTQRYQPPMAGGPPARRESLQQSTEWTAHRVRLIEVGITSAGQAVYEIEASAGGEAYVHAWGQGDRLSLALELRDLHIWLRDLQVAPLIR